MSIRTTTLKSVALALALAVVAGYAAPQNRNQITFVVDNNVRPLRSQLPGIDRDAPTRPLAGLIGPSGHQVDFVQNELVLVTDDLVARDAFVTRWGGVLVKSLNPADYRLTGARQHLVRVNTNLANAASLSADLRSLAPPGSYGLHRVSSPEGLNLLAVAAREAASGLTIGVNWVGENDGFIDRITAESPIGPSGNQLPSCCPNEFGPNGYSPNAFDWNHLDEPPGPGYGVTEAWRALALAGKLGNKSKIAVLDQGFLPNADFPANGVAWAVGGFDPIGTIALAGNPWHGTLVVGAGMAVPNNGFGAAGPGGPVAEPILIYTSEDPWTSSVAVMSAAAFGAHIINMSYHMAIPATLSFTVMPFDITTAIVRESGVLIFASAGNNGGDVDEEDCVGFCWEEEWYTPCENAGVICVGGLGAGSIWRAGNSNFGTNGDVDIFAPYTVLVGPDATPSTNFAQIKNGTSYSSPYMAGVAALVWAANPGLDADAVEAAIIAAAKGDSPDGDVSRYVDAFGAVKSVLGNIPPGLKILQPANGVTVGAGGLNIVTFEAAVDDYEDGNSCCAVTWTSNKDGVMGQGKTLNFTFSSTGTRTVTATAKDSQGATAQAPVIVSVANTAPTVSIKKPAPGSSFNVGATVVFEGDSYDANEPLFKLPCSSLKWTSSKAGDPFPVTGCAPQVIFPTADFRTVTLTGTDSAGATGTKTVTFVVVVPAPNSPPAVTILNPKNDAFLDAYSWVTLKGKVDDPDNKGPISYKWMVKLDDWNMKTIATGTANDNQEFSVQWQPVNHVLSNWTVRIYLFATDADGQNANDFVENVYVSHGPK